MRKPDAISQITSKLLELHPDAPARTLARRLVRETNNAITLEQARSRIRNQIGSNGARSKKASKFKRDARKPGQGVEMPASKVEAWEPFVLDVVGTVGILSDIHVPYHDEVALNAAVKYLETIGIDAIPAISTPSAGGSKTPRNATFAARWMLAGRCLHGCGASFQTFP
jgi:hypothetical protein